MSPRSWTIWSIAALLLAGPVVAQQPGRVEVGGFGQWTWFDDNAGRPDAVPENGIGYGGRLGVFLTPRWQIEGDGYYSPQDRKQTEEFCCLGLFPTQVTASAFALRLNYNMPLAMMGGRSHLIFGGGAVRTNYKFEGGNSPDSSTANFGPSGLLGLRVGLADRVALRFDGVVDYMPNKEPEANMNLHARAGLSFLLGSIGAPPPPPPPARTPPPPPPPPPAPREERVTVCVIDPTSDTGVRTVQAIYLVDSGDTVVVQGANRVALRTTTGSVVVAPSAAWYVAGEPLIFLDDGETRTEFLSYGGARVVPEGSLAYLGNQFGIAVYADADDVADVRDAWRDLRNANRTGDVDDILEEREELLEEFNELEFLYVPMDPVGCVFQALQRVEGVIKAD